MDKFSGPVELPSSLPSVEMEVCGLISESRSYRIYKVRQGTKFIVLKTPALDETVYVEMLRREFEIGYTLSHPSVVQILSFEINTPVGPALAMEYIEGVSLEDFLASAPSRSLRKRVMSDVLDGVDYIHRRGILHNDLKPSNIIVTSEGHAKIIDFGFSVSGDGIYSGVRGGSEGFTAPEILNGEAPSGVSSDIYSLGALLKYMSLASSPVIRKAMADDPSRRYQDVSALRRAMTSKSPFIIFAVLLTLAVCLILIFLPSDERNESPNGIQQKDSEDFSHVEQYIEDEFNSALEKISQFPYSDYVVLVQGEYLLRIRDYSMGLSYDESVFAAPLISETVDSLVGFHVSLPAISSLPDSLQQSLSDRLNVYVEEFMSKYKDSESMVLFGPNAQ